MNFAGCYTRSTEWFLWWRTQTGLAEQLQQSHTGTTFHRNTATFFQSQLPLTITKVLMSCWVLISGLSGSGLYCDQVRETVPSSVCLYSLVRWKPQTWLADNMSYKPKFYCKHVMYYIYLMVLCVLWANNSCLCKSKIMLYIHKAIIQLLVFLQLKLEFTSQKQLSREPEWNSSSSWGLCDSCEFYCLFSILF